MIWAFLDRSLRLPPAQNMTDFRGVTIVIPECCYRGSRSFTTTCGEVTFKYVNYLIRLAILVIFAVFAGNSFALQAPENASHATIFIYHKFGEDRYPTTNVSVERFAQQLQFLKENHYHVVPLADLVASLVQKKNLADKTVAITIDDGYRSTYTEAWPLLQRYGYPFTVFLYVKAIDKKYKNFLTWDEIAEMHRAGVDFEDHGYSHFRFGSRPQGLNESEYREWITTDLEKGNSILAKHLGSKPLLLALPYGEYNSIIQEEANKLGYQAVFSQDPGSVSGSTDPFSMPREPILGYDWATIAHFQMVLECRDLPLVDMVPAITPLRNTVPEEFCATLLHPELYQRESLQIYVSELGWHPGVLHGDRLCINNTSPLLRRSNRVAVSAREKKSGRDATRFWLLIQTSLEVDL